MFADIFTIFTGIYSDPVAFLTSKLLIMLFTWSTVAALISSSAVAGNSFLIFSYFLLFLFKELQRFWLFYKPGSFLEKAISDTYFYTSIYL